MASQSTGELFRVVVHSAQRASGSAEPIQGRGNRAVVAPDDGHRVRNNPCQVAAHLRTNGLEDAVGTDHQEPVAARQ